MRISGKACPSAKREADRALDRSPARAGDDLYFVLCDYGPLGLAYAEVDPDDADRETLVRDLAQGQFTRPVQVICVNLVRGLATDVTDVTDEVMNEVAVLTTELKKA